ncbi:MAG: TetR family transcriptional regulator [Candidatus Glassbacteria bacterium]|nr:TetR family transcriptional regulator [Candidatus Glassbacteria bacterium]
MTPPGDRHAERREQSIERLQRAAVDLLAARSYADIRIEDITGQAGMAKGSLYMYFEGKDELYLKVFDRFFESLFAEQFEEMAGHEDPGEALRGMVDFAVEQISPSDEIMFIYRATMDPALMKLVRPHTEKFMARYVEFVESMFRQLGRTDVGPLSYLLAVLLDGLWFYRIMELEPAELAESQRARQDLKQTICRLFKL